MRRAPDRMPGDEAGKWHWLRGLLVYLSVMAAGNLVWETLHLPLYTLWRDGTLYEQAFAVVHCTFGDVLIALSTALLALVIVGDRAWPARRFWPVVCLAVALGIAYTIYSEWLNVEVRAAWAYSNSMPIVAVGNLRVLSPIAQWIVLPIAAFVFTRQWIAIGWRSI